MGKVTGFIEFQRLQEAAEDSRSRVNHYREFVMHLTDQQAAQQGAVALPGRSLGGGPSGWSSKFNDEDRSFPARERRSGNVPSWGPRPRGEPLGSRLTPRSSNAKGSVTSHACDASAGEGTLMLPNVTSPDRITGRRGRARQLGMTFAAMTIAIAVTCLAGWVLGLAELTHWGSHHSSAKPLT